MEEADRLSVSQHSLHHRLEQERQRTLRYSPQQLDDGGTLIIKISLIISQNYLHCPKHHMPMYGGCVAVCVSVSLDLCHPQCFIPTDTSRDTDTLPP